MKCDVINTKYKLVFERVFLNEVERVVNENTKNTNGIPKRVNQLGEWIKYLLRYIQDIGNLNDTSDYVSKNGHIEWDTNQYGDYGIGTFCFKVQLDKANGKLVIKITNASFNYATHTPFVDMLEQNGMVSLKDYITEHLSRHIV